MVPPRNMPLNWLLGLRRRYGPPQRPTKKPKEHSLVVVPNVDGAPRAPPPRKPYAVYIPYREYEVYPFNLNVGMVPTGERSGKFPNEDPPAYEGRGYSPQPYQAGLEVSPLRMGGIDDISPIQRPQPLVDSIDDYSPASNADRQATIPRGFSPPGMRIGHMVHPHESSPLPPPAHIDMESLPGVMIASMDVGDDDSSEAREPQQHIASINMSMSPPRHISIGSMYDSDGLAQQLDVHRHHANAVEPQAFSASTEMSGIDMSVSQSRHIGIASMDEGEPATHGRYLHQHPSAAADPQPLIASIDISGIDMNVSQPRHIFYSQHG